MARTIITPPKGLGLPSFREIWSAREVLWRFGTRDILLRYRQTVVGVAWVVIQPLVGAGIFSLVFGGVAGLPSGGVPYFLFSLAGLLSWNLFASVIDRSAPSLVSNQALVSKVYFPRLLVPASTVLSVLLDTAVGLGLFVVLLFVFGVNPGWPVLLFPVWALLALMAGLGLGMAASAIMVKYRDVGYVLPWVVQVLFYATPVAYALEGAPADLRWLFELNPLTWMMEAFRWSMLGLDAPPLWQMGGFALFAVLLLALGLTVFQRYERTFADVI
ncbi:ABC transporter permease [Agromyces seonyuensis]|uniref:Transport permease protein n=1 Tax=Agromyces seonyuensis TaxID=2662446 RepID=A0A6I4NT13_9MICO|nr:ABC transporter permease [Agromyces seonyuensis]MWB97271.1 ABC transporter permease [Agromyces seonyuensis]